MVVPRDLISILPAIEASGALQAETMAMTETIQLQAPTDAGLGEVAQKFEAVFLPRCRRSSTPGPGSAEGAPLHDIF